MCATGHEIEYSLQKLSKHKLTFIFWRVTRRKIFCISDAAFTDDMTKFIVFFNAPQQLNQLV